MAKMFYTLQETMTALGRNEEGIKQLAREGRLREFRDGPRLMFKADQVEQLKGEMGSGDAVSLAPQHDSGAPLGMAGDSRAGSSAGGLSLADSVGGKPASKEDTQFADIGLSGSLGGSVGGVPSPAGKGGTGTGSGILNLGGSAGSGLGSGGSRGGITVFDVDESQRVDPSAQTAINPGIQEQINLEGVGSGSGLLDLTRESDDTSLGAVFDELQPGQQPRRSGPPPVAAVGMDSGMGGPAISPGAPAGVAMRQQLVAPIYVEQADPLGTALGAASLAAAVVLVFGGFLLASVVMGARPDMLNDLSLSQPGNNFMFFIIGSVAAVLVFSVIGFVLGKIGSK